MQNMTVDCKMQNSHRKKIKCKNISVNFNTCDKGVAMQPKPNVYLIKTPLKVRIGKYP